MAKENNIEETGTTNVEGNDILLKIEEAQKVLDAKAKEIEDKIKALDEKSAEIDKKIEEIPDKDLKKESINTGEALKKEEQITIVIPKSELNPHEKMVPVTVNGYTYQIIRGEKVTVPKTVVDILEEAKYL